MATQAQPANSGAFRGALLKYFKDSEGHPQYDVWLNYALSTNERGRELVKGLARFVPSLKGLRLLDIGSGYGGTSIAAAQEGAQAVGIEMGEAQLRLSKANLADNPGLTVEIHRMDAMDWSKLETLGRFDVITCDNVIEHVPQPEILVAHIRRLLKPAGIAYVTAPNAFSLGQVTNDCHYGQFGLSLLDPADGLAYVKKSSAQDSYDVSRYFTLSGYRGLFEKYGMHLKLLNGVESPDVEVAQMLEQRDKLEQRRAQAQVPAAVAAKVKTLVADYLQRFDNDLAFLRQLPEGAEKQRFTHNAFREYGAELWYFVASPQAARIGLVTPAAAAANGDTSALAFEAPSGPVATKPSEYAISSHRSGLVGPAIVAYKRAVQRLVGPLLDSIMPHEREQAVRLVRNQLLPEVAELRERIRLLEAQGPSEPAERAPRKIKQRVK